MGHTHNTTAPSLINIRISKEKLLLFRGLIFLSLFDDALPREDAIKFEHLTVDQGLSQNSVTCILQDSKGFMWFGTLDGLNRYDGYGFTVYHHDPLDENSLSDSEVFSLYEDHSGTLWIGTGKSYCSLNPADREHGRFTRYGTTPTILRVFEDENGLWDWTGRGLAKFDEEKQRFEPFQDYVKGFEKEIAYRIYVDRSSTLWWWLGNEGLFRVRGYAEKNLSHMNFRHDPEDPTSLFHNAVTQVYEDRSGSIWVGTVDGGLSRLVQDDRGQERFITYQINPAHHISVLLEDRDGDMWIGTEGGTGLVRFTENDGETSPTFMRYTHNLSDPNSLSNNNIMALVQDRSGAIWVGTRGGGVNKFDTEGIHFDHFQHDRSNANSLPHNRVWSFYEDRKGALWSGTTAGLCRLDRKAKGGRQFTNFRIDPEDANREGSLQVRAIHEDSPGTLWIATLGRGLGKFNQQTGQITYYRHDPNAPYSINSDNVYAICEDRTGRMWIGTNGGGLNQFDPKAGRFTSYNHLLKRNSSGQNLGWVITIYEDSQGLLWLGTWKEGLIRFDPETEEFTHYLDDPADPNSLSNHTVFSIYADKSGVLWVGTYGGGLCRMEGDDPGQATFKCFTVRDGLPNNVIHGILEDDFGNLWLSTNQGLSRFNPKTEEFRNYNSDDGLQSNQFNLGAAYKSKRGEMFFGGPNGFNSFYPKNIVNLQPPQIALTGFKKFGKRVRLEQPLSSLRKLDLSYKENFFSFEFVALHYKKPLKNRYAYMLEGFDKEWIDAGSKREAIYTNVDPGNYTFRVKAANSDGIWNAEGSALKMTIHAPFWGTWWFYMLAAGSLFAVVSAAHRYRVREAVRIERARMTERERMRDKMAADIHDELGHRVTNISLASKILKTELKRNPHRIGDILEKITHNADQLFKDMKDAIWELDPAKDSVYALAVQLKNFSDEIFDASDIAFRLVGLTDKLERSTLPMAWRQNLLRLFKEGMHNILKHADGCRNVHLEFRVADHHLNIILTDDGKGFDVADHSAGNGLKNMRERARKINGELEIISDMGRGTKLRFRGKLP